MRNIWMNFYEYKYDKMYGWVWLHITFFLATLLTPSRTAIMSVFKQVHATVQTNELSFTKLTALVALMLLSQTNRLQFCLMPLVALELHQTKSQCIASEWSPYLIFYVRSRVTVAVTKLRAQGGDRIIFKYSRHQTECVIIHLPDKSI